MSNTDPWADPQATRPRKPGMSGWRLATLIVGGIGAVFAVLCCGGFIWLVSIVIPHETKVPDEVAEVGRKALNIDILPDFAPDRGLTIDNALMAMHIAEYTHKQMKGKLIVGSMREYFGSQSQTKTQLSAYRDPEDVKLLGSLDIKDPQRTRDITINGQSVSMSIGEGTDRKTKQAIHTATVEFSQPDGLKYVTLRMDDDIWNEDAVVKMLEDAKTP